MRVYRLPVREVQKRLRGFVKLRMEVFSLKPKGALPSTTQPTGIPSLFVDWSRDQRTATQRARLRGDPCFQGWRTSGVACSSREIRQFVGFWMKRDTLLLFFPRGAFLLLLSLLATQVEHTAVKARETKTQNIIASKYHA